MSRINAVGIIAEYNPFHKGHEYHIAQSKKITGADCTVVVMSGNFVQRGEPAIIDKYIRSNMALQCGADLVIELPVKCALGSSSYFSMGSIKILNALKVNNLCFGSEYGDLAVFTKVADLITNNSDKIDSIIHEQVKTGISYPLARNNAILQCIGDTVPKDFITKPNNILGLEYILEIKKQKADITPHTIKRIGNEYHSTEISGVFASASALRTSIFSNPVMFYDNIPSECAKILKEYFKKFKPVFIDDFTDVIFYKLMEIKNNRIFFENDIADLPDYLLNRLLKNIESAKNVTALIESAKTKDITYTRISRALMHLLLDIKEDDYLKLKTQPCPYIRVLGFNDAGQKYLASVKKDIACPIIVKPADYKDELKQDIYASDIYNMILSHKSGTETVSDYKRQTR